MRHHKVTKQPSRWVEFMSYAEYNELSVDEICDKLGVSKSLFYRLLLEDILYRGIIWNIKGETLAVALG